MEKLKGLKSEIISRSNSETNVAVPADSKVSDEHKKANILIIGITQTGKSTLINFLSGSKEAKVGEGGRSCTTSSDFYKATVTPKAYKISMKGILASKKNPLVFDEVTVGNIVDKYLEEELSLEVLSNVSQTYDLNLLDTPGLDDSGGAHDPNVDENNILTILEMLKKNETVNAVWFLSNSQAPYSASFQQNYHYYKNMVPDFKQKFIIVHTKLSVDALNNNPNLMKNRIKEFREIVDKDDGIKHFFVNALWKPKPYGSLEECFANLALSSLLTLSCSMLPQKVDTLKFLKSARILQLERTLTTFAQGKIEGYTDNVKQLSKTVGQATVELSSLIAKISVSESTIKATQEKLDEIDTSTLVKTGSATTDAEWSFWKAYKSETLKIVTGIPIDTMTKTLGNRNCDFSGEPLYSSDRKEVSQKIESGFWGGLAGTIVSYAKSSVINATEIALLRGKMETLTRDLRDYQTTYNQRNSGSEESKKQMEQIQDYIKSLTYVQQYFDTKQIALEEYKKLRPIYAAELSRESAVLETGHDIKVINSILKIFGVAAIE